MDERPRRIRYVILGFQSLGLVLRLIRVEAFVTGSIPRPDVPTDAVLDDRQTAASPLAAAIRGTKRGQPIGHHPPQPPARLVMARASKPETEAN